MKRVIIRLTTGKVTLLAAQAACGRLTRSPKASGRSLMTGLGFSKSLEEALDLIERHSVSSFPISEDEG